MITRDKIKEIFEGSDGEATRRLYDALQAFGPAGVVALNLFRAQKCSTRAKLYRRRSHKGEAYDRKNWSMSNLCDVLAAHSEALDLRWGWKEDPAREFHMQVLYVDLPSGQVSFHCAARMKGPDYPGDWDGSHQSAGRVVKFVEGFFPAVESSVMT